MLRALFVYPFCNTVISFIIFVFGIVMQVTAIRSALDNGTDFPPCTPHSVCEALVSFLGALPQPLLPTESYPSVSRHCVAKVSY